MVETRRCLACGSIYETVSRSGEPFFHVCGPVVIDGVTMNREGHRDENRIYTDDRPDTENAPIATHPAWEEHSFQTLRRKTRVAHEGLGVEKLHDGPRTPAELGIVDVVAPPIRAKRAAKKKKGGRNVKARKAN